MISLTMATIVCLPLLAADEDSYADAHRKTVETGRPMVIMVGADWCPACKQMEQNVLPKVKERGLLARVAFALVNFDHDRELGQNLTSGGPIPQLIFFRKTSEGWQRRRLIGSHSLQEVEEFIKEEVAEDDSTKKSESRVKKASGSAGKDKGVPQAKPAVKPVSNSEAQE